MDELVELLTAKLTAQGVVGETPLADQELLGLCAPYPDTELIREDLPRVQRAAPSKSKSKASKAKDLDQKELLPPVSET